MCGETFMFGVERVWHRCKRHTEIVFHLVLIGDVGRNFSKAVHIIGKTNQFYRDVGCEALKRTQYHGCSGDFAECADMWQAGWTITGFEQDIAFIVGFYLTAVHRTQTFDYGFGLFEGPSTAFIRYVQINITHG